MASGVTAREVLSSWRGNGKFHAKEKNSRSWFAYRKLIDITMPITVGKWVVAVRDTLDQRASSCIAMHRPVLLVHSPLLIIVGQS